MRHAARPTVLAAAVVVLTALATSPARAADPAAACTSADDAAARFEAIERVLENPAWDRGVLRLLRTFLLQIVDRQRLALQGCVRLNQVQVLGTHNSYHIEPDAQILNFVKPFRPDIYQVEYSHPLLAEQFSSQGIRQIELDVWADPEGGLFARRLVDDILGRDPFSHNPAMYERGFKMIHIPDLDYRSTCETFVACLGEVKAWSEAHPGHLPLAILVELKDDPPILPGCTACAQPVFIGPDELDDLDAEIRSVFPPEHLVTPDDVRGTRRTLEEAVLDGGWPTLGESRGKVLFLMDNGGEKRDFYRAGRPSLDGRPIFTNATPGDADAAFVKLNGSVSSETLIRDVVSAGYLVRTRADSDTDEARSGDVTARDAALRSGAQYVSTDYPVPDPRFGTGYFVAIPDGHPGRCNPVNAPAWCDSRHLER